MGHATYCFLFDTTEESMPVNATHQDMADQLLIDFDGYMDAFGDENNWYTALAVVFPDGDVIKWDNDQIDGFYKDIVADPVGERWANQLAFAKRCIESDVNDAINRITGNYDNEYSFFDWQDAIDQMILTMVGGMQKVAERRGSVSAIEGAACILGQLEDMDDHFPFTASVENPYNTIRAMDFRTAAAENEQDKVAILFADIHT